ncbi:MAG: hypothetical protein WAZ18_01340 [Alphaproteobacteria bacterium]
MSNAPKTPVVALFSTNASVPEHFAGRVHAADLVRAAMGRDNVSQPHTNQPFAIIKREELEGYFRHTAKLGLSE